MNLTNNKIPILTVKLKNIMFLIFLKYWECPTQSAHGTDDVCTRTKFDEQTRAD